MNIIIGLSSKSLTIAGRTFNESEVARFESGTTGVILYAPVSLGGNFTTARKGSASAGYLATGNGLRVKAVQIYANGGAAAVVGVTLLYGDNDVGFSVAGAPTNTIYPGTFSSSIALNLASINSNSLANGAQAYFDFLVPAGKYLAVRSVAGGDNINVVLFCNVE